MPYTSNMLDNLEFNPANFPTLIINDGTVQTLVQAQHWVTDNINPLKDELANTGALLLRGFPVVDAASYDAFFSAFGYANFTYRESLSNAVRINHTERVFTANEAPKSVEIYLHNEMAQTPLYPNIISLFCESAAEHGGETVICRSDSIYTALAAADPELAQKLERDGVKYTTLMPLRDDPGTGQGRSWKGTLSVETKADAEAKLKSLGYTWHWDDGDALRAQTAALPAIKTLADGRKVFFNQLIAAYCGWQGVNENPGSALCFGDNTALEKSSLDTIVAIAESLSYNVPWQDGDVVVLDNNLVMHGRRPFSGERKRKVLVVLGR